MPPKQPAPAAPAPAAPLQPPPSAPPAIVRHRTAEDAAAAAAKAAAAAAAAISPATIAQASAALLKHLRATAQAALFEDSSPVFLEFRLKRMPGRELTKPLQMCVRSARPACSRALDPAHAPPPLSLPFSAAPCRTRCSTPRTAWRCA